MLLLVVLSLWRGRGIGDGRCRPGQPRVSSSSTGRERRIGVGSTVGCSAIAATVVAGVSGGDGGHAEAGGLATDDVAATIHLLLLVVIVPVH